MSEFAGRDGVARLCGDSPRPLYPDSELSELIIDGIFLLSDPGEHLTAS